MPTPRELGALEKRLEKEPNNLPLRVMVAGYLRDAGRTPEAVELYRSVAIAYRTQGRNYQAIAVCRSVLELAPDDAGCRALLAELSEPTMPPPAPAVMAPVVPGLSARRALGDTVPPVTASGTRPPRESATPLPAAVPYHIHDPTGSVERQRVEVTAPRALDEDTRPSDGTSGLAEAARRISGLIAGEGPPPALSRTRGSVVRLSATLPIQRVEPEVEEIEPEVEDEITREPAVEIATHPVARAIEPDFDELPTPVPIRLTPPPPERPTPTPPPERPTPTPLPAPPAVLQAAASAGDSETDATSPVELVDDGNPLANVFFAAVPRPERDAVLRRCVQRTLFAGDLAIRAGESAHPLILVVAGRLEVRADRIGAPAVLEVLDPGSFVGESALLARAPAPHSIVASRDSIVLALPAQALYELASAYPALWAALKDSAQRRARRYR